MDASSLKFCKKNGIKVVDKNGAAMVFSDESLRNLFIQELSMDTDALFEKNSYLIAKYFEMLYAKFESNKEVKSVIDDVKLSLAVKLLNFFDELKVDCFSKMVFRDHELDEKKVFTFYQHIPSSCYDGQWLRQIKYLSQVDLLTNPFFVNWIEKKDFCRFEISKQNDRDRLMAIFNDNSYYVVGFLSKPHPLSLQEFEVSKYDK